MDEETKKVEVVKLNSKTRDLLIEINKNISMLQSQAQIAIQSYIDALELDGEYTLSPDISKLVPKV
jgi:hypothetical protein